MKIVLENQWHFENFQFKILKVRHFDEIILIKLLIWKEIHEFVEALDHLTSGERY